MDSKKRNRFRKKIICIVAALAMVMTLMPMSASAATEKNPIIEVHITSLDTPVVGAPVSVGDVTVTTTPAKEEALGAWEQYWYDETIGAKATGVFLANHKYSLRVILTAKFGYIFEEEGGYKYQVYANYDESHSVSVNSLGRYELRVIGKPAQAATPVTRVRITDLQTPVPGLSCSTEIINISYSPYGLGWWNFEWYDETTKEVKTDEDTFEKGHMYSLRFQAGSDEGYGFKYDENSAYTGTVTFDGLPASEVVKSKEKQDNIVGKSGSFIAQPIQSPAPVSVKLCGYDDIEVTWNLVDRGIGNNCIGYDIYYKRADARYYSHYQGVPGRYGNEWSLDNLRDGAKYYVKVVPNIHLNGTEVTGPAKISSGIYTLKKLNTPTLSKSSSTKVKVKWNNINGESGYQISRSTKKTGTHIVATRYTTTGNYKVLTVKKNKTYYYKVRAFKTVDGKKIYAPWSSVRSYKLR